MIDARCHGGHSQKRGEEFFKRGAKLSFSMILAATDVSLLHLTREKS
jgi:imidazolonepropionase-like amidohydrolase